MSEHLNKPGEGQVTICRFDPERDAAAHDETYAFPYTPGMSVLDVLLWLYENVDGSLSFAYDCRNSHCGLCGMRIDGRPGLACREAAPERFRLDPLANLPVIRDLLVEREDYAQRLAASRLFLERETPRPANGEIEAVDMPAFDRFKQASRCVACYCCLSACPVFTAHPQEFLGPAAFTQLARHAFDPRDDASRKLTAKSGRIDLCLLCGKCSAVCPHYADPCGAIAVLRE